MSSILFVLCVVVMCSEAGATVSGDSDQVAQAAEVASSLASLFSTAPAAISIGQVELDDPMDCSSDDDKSVEMTAASSSVGDSKSQPDDEGAIAQPACCSKSSAEEHIADSGEKGRDERATTPPSATSPTPISAPDANDEAEEKRVPINEATT